MLWWGRFDPDYSRNRILRGLLAALGLRLLDFRPHASSLGDIEAVLRRIPPADLIWVPCFRQRDLAAGLRHARRRGVPLLADPLVSAFDKQVHERGKFAAGTAGAQRLLEWERVRLGAADLVLADTAAHAVFFRRTFGLAETRVRVVHVGAEESLFRPSPVAPVRPGEPLEALFFGSFIGLQGPRLIIEAARRYSGPPLRWTLLGDGPLRAACERDAKGLGNVRFESPLPYSGLAGRIARAQILLGVFGGSDKAGRVIPNKVFQALACGRPVVTRHGEGYPSDMASAQQSGLHWVAPDDPDALAQAVAKLATHPEQLADEGERAFRSYARYLSNQRIRGELAAALATLGINSPACG